MSPGGMEGGLGKATSPCTAAAPSQKKPWPDDPRGHNDPNDVNYTRCLCPHKKGILGNVNLYIAIKDAKFRLFHPNAFQREGIEMLKQ